MAHDDYGSWRCPHCGVSLETECSIVYRVDANQYAHIGTGRKVVLDGDAIPFPANKHRPFCFKCGLELAEYIRRNCVPEIDPIERMERTAHLPPGS